MESAFSNTMNYLEANAANWAIALAILIAGYLIALVVRWVITAAINRTGFGVRAKASGGNIGRSVGQALFWLILLIFILMALGRFPLVARQLDFLNTMMGDIFNYIPKLLAGAAVIFVGIVLANVLRNLIESTLKVAQVDRLAGRFDLADETQITNGAVSKGVARLAAAVVLIFSAIIAVGIWDIPGVSGPVGDMLDLILTYIPRVLFAAAIVVIAVYIGRFVSNLIQSTLPAMGFDRAMSSIEGLDGDKISGFNPSKILGKIAFIAIVLLGLTAAMNVLESPVLTAVFSTLLAIGGKIVLGAIIIGAGIFIANIVTLMVRGAVGDTVANVIRYILIILITFMGLSEMDLGDGIVETAFTAAVIAAAVAAALAFGLGGREWAKAKLNEYFPPKAGSKPAVRKTASVKAPRKTAVRKAPAKKS
ncbi:mechanosensitive ion channel [Robiginitomaculum antarcticum]|uniref:mechanosensitive ion channel n=1 Tax=Robiginitomaculum antarcticum TaxID=437507 RepID=UPI00039C7F6F|nr:mechanosensitive ion channel [Robiginitomaculum antarcticum]